MNNTISIGVIRIAQNGRPEKFWQISNEGVTMEKDERLEKSCGMLPHWFCLNIKQKVFNDVHFYFLGIFD